MAVEVNSFGVPIDSETGYGVSEPRNEASLEEIRNRLPDLYDDNSLLRKQMRSNGIFQPSDMRYWDKFYRFKRIDPHFWIDGGQEYLFFTRPELHIMNNKDGLYKTDYYDTTITGHQISSNVNKVQQVINDVSQAISNFIGDRTKSNTSTVAAPGGTAVIPYFQHLYNTNYKNTKGLHEYKRKFGGEYIEFMGEFDLVNKPFWYKVLPILLKVYRKLKK